MWPATGQNLNNRKSIRSGLKLVFIITCHINFIGLRERKGWWCEEMQEACRLVSLLLSGCLDIGACWSCDNYWDGFWNHSSHVTWWLRESCTSPPIFKIWWLLLLCVQYLWYNIKIAWHLLGVEPPLTSLMAGFLWFVGRSILEARPPQCLHCSSSSH